jgi:exosome complex component MTR3
LRIFEALQPAIRLEAYAKSSIQITILVLESDGACLAHAITCASLALLNAGIEMRDIAIGSSVGFFPGNLMALDCSETEKVTFDQSGELVLSYLPSVGSISQIIFNGNVENSLLSQVSRMFTYCLVGFLL